MAYTPTVWQDGDVITADKLNKLETGVKNEQVGPAGPKGDAGAAGPKGATGAQGVGIKSITGSISETNKLTLTITLTNSQVQTVEGQITPPGP